MAIKIDFVSDVSQVVRDASRLADALDDAVDELQDVRDAGEDGARGLERLSDEGKRAGDSLDKTQRALRDTGDAADDAGRGLKDTGDDFERTGDTIEKTAKSIDDKTEKAFRNMSDNARTSTKKVADDTDRDMRRASESTDTFKSEAKQNLAETASSFDGSLESLVDGIQGTFGGVAADLGPAGMIGGALAGAAIGLGVNVAQSVADGINENGEIAAGLAQQITEVGGSIDDVNFTEKMDEWGYAIQDNREWWELWQDTAQTGFEDVRDASDRAGMSFNDMFNGIAGNSEDAQAALDAVNAEIDRMNGAPGEWFSHPVASPEKMAALNELRNSIQDNIDVQEQAEEIEKDRAEAIGLTTDQIVDQIKAQDELSDTISDSVGSQLDYLDTLDEVNQKISENGAVHGTATKESRDNERALIDLKDAAYDMASAQIAAGESTATVSGQIEQQRADFVRAAEAMGYTTTEAEGLADAYGLVPTTVITNVSAQGVSATKAELNGIERNIPVTVPVSATGVQTVRQTLRSLQSDAVIHVRTTGVQSVMRSTAAARSRATSAW